MPMRYWEGSKSRRIAERIVVEVDITLLTPAHFGNGEGDNLTDMVLLVDSLNRISPLLPGASIAGALRSYLREVEHGYFDKPTSEHSCACVDLFGGSKGNDAGLQSAVIVEDAIGFSGNVEVREGVSINPASHTAKHDMLYNMELWSAGTTFPLRFELLISDRFERDRLVRGFAAAMHGLTEGEITLGTRKRRGYGQFEARNWKVRRFDLSEPSELIDWIAFGDDRLTDDWAVADISQALQAKERVQDVRRSLRIKAKFAIEKSMLVRSSSGQFDKNPDMVHLHTRTIDKEFSAVLPGTSLAGAMRARANKIVNALSGNGEAANLVDRIFGSMPSEVGPDAKPVAAAASHLIVTENIIKSPAPDMIQSRVSIDPFTGGARDTALFAEQPVFANGDTVVSIELRLISPSDAEIGLLLLLLKDMWTANLNVGGERSVGRGRLRGLSAGLSLSNGEEVSNWKIVASDETISVTEGDTEVLEAKVTELVTLLSGGAS